MQQIFSFKFIAKMLSCGCVECVLSLQILHLL